MNYIEQAKRTESTVFNVEGGDDRLLHAGIGIATESGEFLDALKKHIFYGKALDRTNLKEELGDLLWYIAIAMDELGTDFDEVQAVNIAKLTARYPDKFTLEAAEHRDLTTERAILEGPKELKVGDEVRVRSLEDLQAHYNADSAGDMFIGSQTFIVEDMSKFCGKLCTISKVIQSTPPAYQFEEDYSEDGIKWSFSPEMFKIL